MTTKKAQMKKIRIYDMDGTIVCSLHRYRTVKDSAGVERIDLAYWRENEYRAGDDSLLPLANEYQADIADPDTYVVIATARVLNTPDMKFIDTILGTPDYIVSRAADDTRSGGLLKILGLKPILEKYISDDVIFFEDNAVYLKTVCDFFNISGVYVPSNQGH